MILKALNAKLFNKNEMFFKDHLSFKVYNKTFYPKFKDKNNAYQTSF